MAKKKKKEGILSEDQEKKLKNMVNDMLDIANTVVEDYKSLEDELDLSELSDLSGSLTQIHMDSPFLDEIFEGDSWKKVIKNIPTIPQPNNDDNKKENGDGEDSS